MQYTILSLAGKSFDTSYASIDSSSFMQEMDEEEEFSKGSGTPKKRYIPLASFNRL